ncbi:channel accessory protein ArfC, sunset domain variant [Mycobacterium lacus]|uniref:Putative membrane protein ArfC n=1 Tax=Mycobacterium lacus TaxID=169765 RepID=A0A1X1YV32_9MYCO|nr:hypothetical protein [Mycobacterium lacus]MCV7122348.1 hypothetical protein [Mycobacterium lacus]ORW14913.1 hypothetical protein AWC15_12020 [Mycobacterium lacus]BBX95097.1 putative membrane protein ArfC [Mycobacterium lacus]
MSHVQWPLVVLAFVIGLGLTAALMVGRVTPQEPAHEKGPSGAKSGPATAKKATAAEPPTTKISLAQESPTTEIPAAEEPPPTQTPAVEEPPTTQIPEWSYPSYGPGSARAGADGGGPQGWLVKGRTDTRLYYTPDDPTYDPIVAQVWFQDEEAARRAFFTPWRASTKKS